MVAQADILNVLSTILDPEMPISIVDLGIVHAVRVVEDPAPRADPVVCATPAPCADAGPGVPPAGHTGSKVAGSARVEIEILPTFVGCPALTVLEHQIVQKVGELSGVGHVCVRFVHHPPWTVDRITPAGREALRRHGVTVPRAGAAMPRPAAPVPLGRPPTAFQPDRAGHPQAARQAGEPGSPDPVALEAIPCPFCGGTETVLESPFGPTRCRMIYYCPTCKNSFEHLKRV